MKKGQTLVVLLVFIAIAISVTVAAVAVIVSNTTSASKFELGQTASQAAEGGAEKALVKLLRNPNYTGEPPFSLGTASVTVNVVTQGNTKTVVSSSTVDTITRKVQIILNYPQGSSMTITSWKEIF